MTDEEKEDGIEDIGEVKSGPAMDELEQKLKLIDEEFHGRDGSLITLKESGAITDFVFGVGDIANVARTVRDICDAMGITTEEYYEAKDAIDAFNAMLLANDDEEGLDEEDYEEEEDVPLEAPPKEAPPKVIPKNTKKERKPLLDEEFISK